MGDNQREATLYAYLAGLIDGEGTIRINETMTRGKIHSLYPYYSAAMGIGMTDKEAIMLVAKVFGGNVRIEYVPGHRPMYRWGTSGRKRIPAILEKLLPYLRVKKMQAEMAIEFCKNAVTTGFRRNMGLPRQELRRRQEIYYKVKKLNHPEHPQRLNNETPERVKRQSELHGDM